MNEELAEVVEEVVASYLDLLDDPGDVDAQDLAQNIEQELTRAGWVKVEGDR